MTAPGPERIAFIHTAMSEVTSRFATVHKSQFPSSGKLLARMRKHASAALDSVKAFDQFAEALNECCVAAELLNSNGVAEIDYEPAPEHCEKRLDFRVRSQSGQVTWVEVKSVNPIQQDDWQKYQAAKLGGRFPKNVNVLLVRDKMGGEIYHYSFAARRAVLDHVLDTEARLAACALTGTPCTLVVAANPFKFHEGELEDFAFFYFNGEHSKWDEFADMEDHYLSSTGTTLARTISRFAYFGRASDEVWPSRVNWSVKPPDW